MKLIDKYREENGAYPSSMMLEKWCKELGLFPALLLSVPSENRNVPDEANIEIPGHAYAVAYWDGDEHEFYYPWLGRFTTNIPMRSGGAILAAVIFGAFWVLLLRAGSTMPIALNKLEHFNLSCSRKENPR